MLGVQLVEQTTAQGRFPTTYFTSQYDEALFLLDAIFEVLEGFVVELTQIQKFWVRGDVEGHFVKAKVVLIHESLCWVLYDDPQS